ncbi:MAG: permease-like cell division protein FtsX, partial [Gammaproteobacteria bacterium]
GDRMSSPATWLTRHLQSMFAALGRLLRRPLSTLLTTLVIAVALALPAGLWLVVKNARAATGDLATAVQVTAYMKVGTPIARADQLARQLRERPEVASVRVIPAEQALKEFREYSGFGSALDALTDNPLPHALVVQPRVERRDGGTIEALRASLAATPDVDTVQADAEWARRLAAPLDVLRTLFLASAVLLAVGVLAVIGNTIRLEIGARREEIEVTKLVGGSDAFVRRPFLYAGLFQGLFGGLLALGLVSLVMGAVEAPIARLTALYGGRFRLGGLSVEEAGIVLLVGALLGLVGAWIGAARHLSRIEPRA